MTTTLSYFKKAETLPLQMLRAGEMLVPVWKVRRVDVSRLSEGVLVLETDDLGPFELTGPDAIEAILLLKPSATEGRRLKWQKGAWAVHNLIGHPVMQILAWCGLRCLGVWVHEVTIPGRPDSRRAS